MPSTKDASIMKFASRLMLPWTVAWLLRSAAGVHQNSSPRIIEHPEDLYVGRNEPATLNCKAEGEPAPVISWYRDGQPVITANDNPSSHRMLLPNGQLFFLRVVRSKTGDSDIGVYYCNATSPESKVSVISRNASLKIAVMRDEFREQPQNAEVGVGTDVSLDCKPPRGEPEPRVRWMKDEQVLQMTERLTTDDQGSLTIRDTRKEDSGIYMCVAYNVGGEKESIPAQLFVREKPIIVDGPKDTVVQENSDVILQCQASGDPEPVIIWKKLEGQIPAERSQILADRSLKIHNAQVTDEGIYVCRLENSVGWQEAEARLSVHSRPSFLVTPRDKVVGAGRRVFIRCEVTGNPMPAVFWNKASSQTFMFPNQDHGRFRVTEEGSLIIENVQKEDADEYTCQGLSLAGSAYAKARIEVKDTDTRPPPIIHQGPQNQTLPIAGTAILPCLVTGDPAPAIYWLKNGVILSLRETRFNIRESGALEITELRRSDSGLYTCKAVSETGETGWSAALVVESTDNPFIVFHRTPEPTTFPGSPTKPIVSDVMETSVKLSWKPNLNQGASPVLSYSVEYFSHDTGEGWVLASEEVKDQTYTVRNLQPNTSYLFLIRAKNNHGLSLPSPVTSVIKTKGEELSNQRPTSSHLDLTIVSEKLSSGQVIHMAIPEVLSSTTIKLNFELRKNVARFIEGFHIKYRIAQDLEENPSDFHQSDYVIRTIQSSTATTYIISGLQKYTWYEVNIRPYYATVEGTESSTVRVRTLEDVPSSPPGNIRATMLENDTLLVIWQPPLKQYRNGVLQGYHVYMYGNESKFDRIVDVNSSMESVFIRHLVRDMSYRLQMAAYNRMGEGVKSEAIILGRPVVDSTDSLLNQPWFLVALIVTIGITLWIMLCVLSICIYRKHKARSQMKQKAEKQCQEDLMRSSQKSSEHASHVPLLVGKTKESCTTQQHTAIASQPCMTTCCYENESPSDGDSKTNGSLICDHNYQTLESVQNLDNEYQCKSCYHSTGAMPCNVYCHRHSALAAPYATTTLFGGRMGDIPNPQAYMIHQPSNCSIKQRNSASNSKSDSPSSSKCGGSAQRIPVSFSVPGNQSCNHPVFDKGLSPCDSEQYNHVYNKHRMGNVPDTHMTCKQFSGYNEDHNYAGVDQPRCSTPESTVTDSEVIDCSQGTWPSVTEMDSDANYSSDSSHGAGATDRLAAETDFASAITRAAEGSGMTVVGSTVNPLSKDIQKVKKSGRPRQRAQRSPSPYSTDSNYDAVPVQHKPYLKSDRQKQNSELKDERVINLQRLESPRTRPMELQNDDIPYTKPAIPSNSSLRSKPQTSFNVPPLSRTPYVVGNSCQSPTVAANQMPAYDTRQVHIL